jgi:hypothetical protein
LRSREEEENVMTPEEPLRGIPDKSGEVIRAVPSSVDDRAAGIERSGDGNEGGKNDSEQ